MNNAEIIYGETFTVYNVHILLYISADMRFFGSLKDISAVSFGNYFQIYINKHIKK